MVIQPPLYLKVTLTGLLRAKKGTTLPPLDLGHVDCLWLGGKNQWIRLGDSHHLLERPKFDLC